MQPFGVQMSHLRATANGAQVYQLDRAVPSSTLKQMARELQNGDADVEYAEPDLIMRPQLVPTDPSYSRQWDLFETTAGLNPPTAWDKSTGAGLAAVTAVKHTGGKASYANYGSVVDVAAPGGDSGAGILSALNAGTTTPGADSYAEYMGTSMATPHVAGVAALMLARNPSLTPDQVETLLKASVRAFPVACSGCGTGILDANAAVDTAIAAGTTTAAATTTVSSTTVARRR